MQPQNPPVTKISAGRDITGQVVVGDGNLVVSKPAAPDPAPALQQQNTVNDRGTAYSAAHGDIHIHHHKTEDDTSEKSGA